MLLAITPLVTMNIPSYMSSMPSMPSMQTLINPSTILFCWMLFSHLYTLLTLQPSISEPIDVSGEQEEANADQVEAGIHQDTTATLVSDFELTIIDILFTVEGITARELRKSLAPAIQDLTLTKVNSTLYSLLRRGVITMKKDGITPVWRIAS
jgi:hypothetical protein